MDNIISTEVKKGFMNDITRIKIEGITEALSAILDYLYSRWRDEKEHEDFNDYIAKMKEHFDMAKIAQSADNAVFVIAHNRPFGLMFDFEGWQVDLSVDMKEYGWKAKKIKR